MRAASLLAFSLPFVVSCNASAQASALRIVLESNKSPRAETYLPGEQIRFRATLKNMSAMPVTVVDPPFLSLNRANSPWRMRTSEEDPGPLCILEFARHFPQPIVIQPGEGVTREVSLLWELGTGEHELWLEYEIPPSLDWFLERENIPRVRLESNHVRLEIVEPTGVDADVIARFGGSTCDGLRLDGAVRDTILEEYPTSTFAGWALGYASPQDVDKMISLLRERVASYENQALPRPVLETNQHMKAFTRQRRDEMPAYLARHPDFVDADRIRLGIAHYSLELGDVAAAMTQLERLHDVPDLPRWMKEQVEALKAYAESVTARPGAAKLPESEQ